MGPFRGLEIKKKSFVSPCNFLFVAAWYEPFLHAEQQDDVGGRGEKVTKANAQAALREVARGVLDF
mgnify:CR=1 FL=1